MITRFRPARCAASAFSRRPPIGSTWPVSVISPVIPTSSETGWLRTSEAIAVAIVIPADGPSFGTAPAGTCRWTSCSVNQFASRPSCVGVRAHPGERGLRRLLHHVAELAGDRQPPLARIRRRLEEEHVAADGREREAGRDARIRRALAHLAFEPPRAEPRSHAPLVDPQRLRARLALGDLPCAPCAGRRRAAVRGCARRPRACTRG